MTNPTSGRWAGFTWQALVARVRSLLLGAPLATSVQLEHRLPIIFALPVFASDALSSVSYATEELLLVLAEYGITDLVLYISFAIVALLIIVGISFRQAIHLYPAGGGSYSVVRDHLGRIPGSVAASALTIDYILTVAVSVSAGVAALTSTFPYLREHPGPVWLAILLIILITLVNLRGTRESGWTFALPAYSFVTMIGILIITSVYRYIAAGGNVAPAPVPPNVITAEPGGVFGFLAAFVIMHAFANGCAAMTGVEAVADGVTAFKPPEATNAARTLMILIGTLIFLFLGVGFATYIYHARPSETVTLVTQLAAHVFGTDIQANYSAILYYLTTFATLAVLMVAANTAFAGFPRLAAIVARDGYMPKALASLGDRLVFTRGILALTVVSIILVWALNANVTRLIGLYAVGVFLTFTLTQTAVVRRILDQRGPGWQRRLIIGGIGALATGIVTIVIAITKFADGAFIVLILIPVLVLIAMLIRRHYEWFDRTMIVHDYDYNPLADQPEPLTVLVLISSDIHRGILEGLECGRALTAHHPDSVLRAVHVELDPEKSARLKAKWEVFVEPYLGDKIKLDIVPSPYRWLIEPVLDYIDWTDLERTGDRVIVVLPEFETGNVITHFLHNFTARRLRTALLNRPHITVVSSRFFMRPMAWRLGRGGLVY